MTICDIVNTHCTQRRRYDTHAHHVTETAIGEEIFPGQDYSNPRVRDFTKGLWFTWYRGLGGT